MHIQSDDIFVVYLILCNILHNKYSIVHQQVIMIMGLPQALPTHTCSGRSQFKPALKLDFEHLVPRKNEMPANYLPVLQNLVFLSKSQM